MKVLLPVCASCGVADEAPLVRRWRDGKLQPPEHVTCPDTSPVLDKAELVETRLDSLTYGCPIAGCEWKLHVPVVLGAPPHSFIVGLAALEVLSHLMGRYGAEGRTPHGAEEVAALTLSQIRNAAFPEQP